MKTNRLNWLVIASALLIFVSTPAWADGKRPHHSKGKGKVTYHTSKHHHGHGHGKSAIQPSQGRHYQRPHCHTPQYRHHHKHPHFPAPKYGHRHHKKPGYPHPAPRRQQPRYHHPRTKDGGYLISAAIAEPGLVVSFTFGERW